MDYPPWLSAGLLKGFDWSASIEATMPRFLDEYTLHDSEWIGLWSEPGWESIALIGWDTHWSQGRVPYPVAGTPAGYPFLLLRFERLYRLNQGSGDHALSTIAGASSRLALPHEHDFALPKGMSEGIFHTIFTPVVGADLELWHGGETRLLCLDFEGRALPIPDL